MNSRERECYRILHTQGEKALNSEVGVQMASDLLARWEDTGAIKIVQLSPGKAPVPVATMTAAERSAWTAHVAAHSGYTVKTFAKYAK
jgi:hypothetical protein